MTNARLLLACCAPAMLGLAGCGGDSASSSSTPPPTAMATPTPTVSQQIASLEAQGALPRLDRSSSVAGPDVNANGVRDDVDAYIAAQNLPDGQRAAAVQLAKAGQLMLVANPADKAQVEAANLADARAVRCAFSRFTDMAAPAQMAGTIEKITANTKPRLLAYLAFAKASDGTVLPSPEGDTCD